ncbi:MAG: hypothetical protein RDU14_15475 [Melioribacteraceae bacterium]|nr:hypothetical protein [Melioribacteraceae bacterium]
MSREFNRQKAKEVWTSDITYIRTDEGWLYLATIIDINSRKIIGQNESRSHE